MRVISTIREIAAAAGVSTSTVSKALNGYPYVNEETRKRVLAIAKEKSFTPNFFARSLIKNRTYLIGVLIYDEWKTGLTHPLFGGIVEGFKKSAEARGYELIIIKESFLDAPGFVEHCRQRGIEGVFLVVGNFDNRAILDVVKSEIPCISVDLYDEKIATVMSDNFQGGYDATRYLIELGHKRIAHIAGNMSKPAGTERLRGYKKALADAGIAVDERLIKMSSKYLADEGKELMLEFINEGVVPTAVFAASDFLAYGVIAACNESGISVPSQMSVIGFDDIDTASYFNPSLTTVRQNRVAIGQKAGETLADMIEQTGKGGCPHCYLETDLIIRHSTAPSNV